MRNSEIQFKQRRDFLLATFPPLGPFQVESLETSHGRIPRIRGEFWPAGQRRGHSLHEISYRACYKPELPGIFIQGLTQPGQTVYDPFGGRGTTALEAALRGRDPISNDVNPLSNMLLAPRFAPPNLEEISSRLSLIPRQSRGKKDLDLSMFFHPKTESEIRALRTWFKERLAAESFDRVDGWIRMVALNRLTGHSAGFFSVYSLPPNQAVSAKKQAELNHQRGQTPDYRDTHALIQKKSRSLLRSFVTSDEALRLKASGRSASLHCGSADQTPHIPSHSVDLVVTSPPFLDVVQYHTDNWMRNWFAEIDESKVAQSFIYERTLDGWSGRMSRVFHEIHRVLKPGAWFAIEVGDVKKGTIQMEDLLLPLGEANGFGTEGILIHTQAFTKTAHIWGVRNNAVGTNSQRIVLFRNL